MTIAFRRRRRSRTNNADTTAAATAHFTAVDDDALTGVVDVVAVNVNAVGSSVEEHFFVPLYVDGRSCPGSLFRRERNGEMMRFSSIETLAWMPCRAPHRKSQSQRKKDWESTANKSPMTNLVFAAG